MSPWKLPLSRNESRSRCWPMAQGLQKLQAFECARGFSGGLWIVPESSGEPERAPASPRESLGEPRRAPDSPREP
eukprot:14567929-Alexandrium_andersonii.AAC.1